MSWHPDCYTAVTGIVVRGSKSKYQTRCQAGYNCLHGGQVQIGEQYYYNVGSTFNGKAAVPTKTTDTATTSADSATLQEAIQAALEKKQMAATDKVSADKVESAVVSKLTPLLTDMVKNSVSGLVDTAKMSEQIAKTVLDTLAGK